MTFYLELPTDFLDIQNALGTLSQVSYGEHIFGHLAATPDHEKMSYLSKLLRTASLGDQQGLQVAKAETIKDFSKDIAENPGVLSEGACRALIESFQVLVDFGSPRDDQDSRRIFRSLFPVFKVAFKVMVLSTAIHCNRFVLEFPFSLSLSQTCDNSALKEAICSLMSAAAEAKFLDEPEFTEILDVLKVFLQYARRIETSLLLQVAVLLQRTLKGGKRIAHGFCSNSEDGKEGRKDYKS